MGRCSRRLLLLLVAGALPALGSCAPAQGVRPPDDYGNLGDFSLTERGGRTVTAADLHGKVLIVSFVFTRCTRGCPQIAATLERLQRDLKPLDDVRLVTITVDPDHDDPGELAAYADHYHADPQRWLFLTGSHEEVHRVLRDTFHVSAVPVPWYRPDREGNEVVHDTRLVLVDRQGRIRGYYPGLASANGPDGEREFEAALHRLEVRATALNGPDFPLLNATLNALSTLLLLLGFAAVRGRLLRLHVACMLTALVVSAVFLGSYLYYHIVIRQGQSTRFAYLCPDAPAWVGTVYLGILLTHIVLAAFVPPLALYTAYQGWRDRLARHRWIGYLTLPVWLYVSVTGVVVYWLLYRLYNTV